MTDKLRSKPLDAVQLDSLFEAASDVEIAPTEAFWARLTEDAVEVHDGALVASSKQNAKGASLKNTLQNLWQEMGGWRALGGLTAVLAIGVMIGFNPPDVAMASLEDLGLVASDEVLLVGLEGDWFGFDAFEGAEG
ncbi:hypothetical protein [Nereida sp. NH-UV-3]|uniref:hypothetical protein n=1 Tax=Nereida TaxID=282198 RepID=UPI0036F21060